MQVVFISTSAKEVVFSPMSICWLDGLVVSRITKGKKKNYIADFHKTWMENGSWQRIDPINFWC